MEDAIIAVKSTSSNTTETLVKARNFQFIIDEPPFFDGEDKAPSPVEFFLGAMAGCINAIGQAVAKEMNLSLRKLDIEINGTINSAKFKGISFEQRSGFKHVDVAIHVDADASEEQLAQWRIQVIDRCPVIDNLLNPATLSITVNEANR